MERGEEERKDNGPENREGESWPFYQRGRGGGARAVLSTIRRKKKRTARRKPPLSIYALGAERTPVPWRRKKSRYSRGAFLSFLRVGDPAAKGTKRRVPKRASLLLLLEGMGKPGADSSPCPQKRKDLRS